MPENMSISVNGQSQVPPGFRFHPTEEELLHYYLRKKVTFQKIDLDVILDVDLNKLEPWDIQEKCRIGSTPQNDWYFFSHKDKKYPTGTRTNRATAAGFWKATGRDKVIYSSCRRIGMRKTLVFYNGRAPHGHKSDWIMHEYRLLDDDSNDNTTVSDATGEGTQEEGGWVVCRIFKKKLHHKTLDTTTTHSPSMHSIISAISHDQEDVVEESAAAGTLEQIFHHHMMGSRTTTCMEQDHHHDHEEINGSRFLHDRLLMKLTSLNSVIGSSSQLLPPPPPPCGNYQQVQWQMVMTESDAAAAGDNYSMTNSGNFNYQPSEVITSTCVNDWKALDQLVASHLNGPINDQPNMPLINGIQQAMDADHNNGEFDLWDTFTRSY